MSTEQSGNDFDAWDLQKLRDHRERLSIIHELKIGEINQRAIEKIEESLWDQWVDPREPFYGPNGEQWIQEGSSAVDPIWSGRFRSEAELQLARSQCRWLSQHNEHAICVHELMASYVVGEGFEFTVTAKDRDDPASIPFVEAATEYKKCWEKENKFLTRQYEKRLRIDRDGEAITRKFKIPGKGLQLRIVEPQSLKAPDAEETRTWGVENEPGDVETVVAYWIDGNRVPAEEIQHVKRGADLNVKRGVPLLYPIINNLKRIDSTRKNMTTVFGAQTAIAAIRRMSKTRSDMESYIGAKASYSRTLPGGSVQNMSLIKPGSILDQDKDTEIEFTSAKVNVDGGNKIIQAELRAIGSRVGVPEYMISGDASNANYSSTLIAEGPAVKMFLRHQKEQMCSEHDLLWEAFEYAEEEGLLPAGTCDMICLDGKATPLTVRNELAEVQALQIELQNGVLSVRTWRVIRGYDNDAENANITEEAELAQERKPITGPMDQQQEKKDDGTQASGKDQSQGEGTQDRTDAGEAGDGTETAGD